MQVLLAGARGRGRGQRMEQRLRRIARGGEAGAVVAQARIGRLFQLRRRVQAGLPESCRRYNVAGEAQCRARVCEKAGRKEPVCKRAPAARADSAS
jgi:hypothetical protein